MSTHKTPPGNDEERDLFLSYSDIKQMLMRHGRFLMYAMVACALLACFYRLSRSVEYSVTATFKEKGKTSSGIEGSSLSLMLSHSLGGNESDAVSWMRSRKLMERLVQQLDLQGSVAQPHATDSLLGRLFANLKVEHALYKGIPKPVLPERKTDISVRNVVYKDEVGSGLSVSFNNETDYTLYTADGERIGEGQVGIPFVWEQYALTIERQPSITLTGKTYDIYLAPLYAVADNLLKNIKVESDREDHTLLNIKCGHCDRHQAAAIANALMDLYQEHTRSEQVRIAHEQIAYLQTRQDRMGHKLKDILDNHAEGLTTDLSSSGFASSEKAMEFIAATQLDYRRRMMALDMEARRLKKGLDGDDSALVSFMSDTNSPQINLLVNEVRDLRQQADVIDVALRTTSIGDRGQNQLAFDDQLKELEEVKKQKEEAKVLLSYLDQGKIPESATSLHEDPRFMVNRWQSRLETMVADDKFSSESDRELACCYDGYYSYISNLLHLLDVQERSIQERLKYQQGTQNDFQGINLVTARELYLTYCKDLHTIEASILQHRHVLDEMENPSFEMCSLGAILHDPVSAEMIGKASKTTLALKDSNNRSSREQERLRDEIAVQKNFLSMHVEQTLQLLQIRYDLIKQKIRDLQNVNLALIHQQISILEKHLNDYVNARISALQQEEELIVQHQAELQNELTQLPSKWVSEKLITLEMDGSRTKVEEIARLVESKNISSNLEVIQSAPVDVAIAPIHPRPPRLLLFALAGAIAGGFLTFTGLLIATVSKGIPATQDNLRNNGQRVLGTWQRRDLSDAQSPLSDHDLGILRSLIAFHKPETGKRVLLVLGVGQDFTPQLGHLLSIQGYKSVIVPLAFDQADSETGLLQYLKGEIAHPKLITEAGYDRIATGGYCRYAHELISSDRFSKLIDNLAKSYDWIILTAPVQPESSESQALLQRYPHAVVEVGEESLAALSPLFSPTISFVFDKPSSK